MFKTPWILALIPVVLAAVILIHQRQRPAAVRFSHTAILPKGIVSWRQRLQGLPFALRLISLTLFIMALAGPRSVLDYSEYKTEGIDIVLAIDVSTSMAAEDFLLAGKRENRLEVVKSVVKDFVTARRSDRIGLVAFASQAYTVSPLTTDQNWLLSNLERLRFGLIQDGTAVGSGLSSALLRLKDSKAKSRVVILLTDGINNTGEISPLEAAKMAQAMGIKVYTIGAGSDGPVPFPVQDMWGRTFYQQAVIEMDETTLKKIAQMTSAQYFRATDTQRLREIYTTIDRLEKTKIEQYGYREYKELFSAVLLLALVLLGLELLLRNTVLLVLP